MAFLKHRARLVGLIFAGALFGSGLTGSVMAYQGHMWNALHAEQNALAQLQMAVPDKGGHRVNAINLLNQAITQTHLGITAGAR
ncbi:MAG: hypothetical protein JO233_09580 [Candidatus Eremiobacteraeota bacterium]|nr:hypothetical protein [Candidatus Eremiobacteraeota bacterium]